MIDLLVACIAFLLVTAVWAKTSSVEAHHHPQRAMDGPIVDPLPPEEVLNVHIRRGEVTVANTMADEQHVPYRGDPTALAEVFHARRLSGQRTHILQISADDTTAFADIVRVMDVANGEWNGPGGQNPVAIHFR
jgi:biopolymer transport protein ExbD